MRTPGKIEVKWSNVTLKDAVRLLEKNENGWIDGDRKTIVLPLKTKMQQYANEFVGKFGLDDPSRQILCIEEEYTEFVDAHHFNKKRENNELADLVITCYVYANICGYDLDAEIDRKMKINLNKTGKDATGKVK